MLTVYSRGVPINSKKIEFNECLAAWHNLAFSKNYRIYDASAEVQPTDALVYSLKIILTFQHVFTLLSVGLKLGEICSENKRAKFSKNAIATRFMDKQQVFSSSFFCLTGVLQKIANHEDCLHSQL